MKILANLGLVNVKDGAIVFSLICPTFSGNCEALFPVVAFPANVLASGNVVLEPRDETFGGFRGVESPAIQFNRGRGMYGNHPSIPTKEMSRMHSLSPI